MISSLPKLMLGGGASFMIDGGRCVCEEGVGEAAVRVSGLVMSDVKEGGRFCSWDHEVCVEDVKDIKIRY